MQRLFGLFVWELSFALVAMGLGVGFVVIGLGLGANDVQALAAHGWLFVALWLVMGAWRMIAEIIARRLSG